MKGRNFNLSLQGSEENAAQVFYFRQLATCAKGQDDSNIKSLLRINWILLTCIIDILDMQLQDQLPWLHMPVR